MSRTAPPARRRPSPNSNTAAPASSCRKTYRRARPIRIRRQARAAASPPPSGSLMRTPRRTWRYRPRERHVCHNPESSGRRCAPFRALTRFPHRRSRRAHSPRVARGSGARARGRHCVRALRPGRAREGHRSGVHRRHSPHRRRRRSVPLAPAARARGPLAHDRARGRDRRDGLRRIQPPGAPRADSHDQVNEGDGAVGETASARTERELAALRAEIDTDVDYLLARVRDDVDPRNLVRRQPLAVFGTLGSFAAIVGIALASRVKSFRRSRTEKELDQIVARLGGRLDRLKGRARKRFRETLKKEIGEVETGPRAKQMAWESATAALTAAATLFARRFISRLTGDEELPDSEA